MLMFNQAIVEIDGQRYELKCHGWLSSKVKMVFQSPTRENADNPNMWNQVYSLIPLED